MEVRSAGVPMRFLRPGEMLDRSHDPHPTVTRALTPGRTALDVDGTHHGVVEAGRLVLESPASGRFGLGPGMWFVAPGQAVVDLDGTAFVTTRLGYRGLFALGGPVESTGRLTYIDGCSDTVLVGPPRRGDPCLNLLVVPPGTDQTAHSHPTLRAGIVVAGQGVCRDEWGDHPLEPGDVWCIPPDTVHAFRTREQPLSVVAFHPDSDTGPTDDDHPMRNRTVVGA